MTAALIILGYLLGGLLTYILINIAVYIYDGGGDTDVEPGAFFACMALWPLALVIGTGFGIGCLLYHGANTLARKILKALTCPQTTKNGKSQIKIFGWRKNLER